MAYVDFIVNMLIVFTFYVGGVLLCMILKMNPSAVSFVSVLIMQVGQSSDCMTA